MLAQARLGCGTGVLVFLALDVLNHPGNDWHPLPADSMKACVKFLASHIQPRSLNLRAEDLAVNTNFTLDTNIRSGVT